jgi:hypothetical protein
MFVDHDETNNLHFSETELLEERRVVFSFSILDTMNVFFLFRIKLIKPFCSTLLDFLYRHNLTRYPDDRSKM